MIDRHLESSDKRLRRETNWCGVCIHHTGQINPKSKNAFENIIHWLSKKDKYYVSSHFVISYEGHIAQLVDPKTHEAFHAGRSKHWHPYKRRVCSDWNRYSIGIELVGDGNRHEYSEAQYKSLARLVKKLMLDHPSIHPQAIVGHDQISPGRKVDPGSGFHWHRFFKSIYV